MVQLPFLASWFYDLRRVWMASRLRSLERLGSSRDDFAGQQRRNWKFWVESLRKAPPRISRPLATEHQWGAAIPRLAAPFAGDNMIPPSEFPAIDATLNATSALLLTLGYFFIRRKRIRAHKVCMLSAFATSSLFLGCYIWYHAHHGVTRFAGQGAVRDLYLALLGSHTILAVVIVPLILTTLYRAWRGRFERHKKIARWTLPLWFYVSVTGVVVYWMLYHLYAQVAAR